MSRELTWCGQRGSGYVSAIIFFMDSACVVCVVAVVADGAFYLFTITKAGASFLRGLS
jgi:hypothetical protein